MYDGAADRARSGRRVLVRQPTGVPQTVTFAVEGRVVVMEVSCGPPASRSGLRSLGLCPLAACPDWADRIARALRASAGRREEVRLVLSELPMVHVYVVPDLEAGAGHETMTAYSAPAGMSVAAHLTGESASELACRLESLSTELSAYDSALGLSSPPDERIGIPMAAGKARPDPADGAALRRLHG